MDDLILKISEFFIGYGPVGAIAFILVVLLINLKKIIKLPESFRKSKLKWVTGALECEFIDPPTKELLADELVLHYCKFALGLDVPKQFRQALVTEYRKTEGRLSFYCFRRSLPFLTCKSGNLKANITPWNTFLYYAKVAFGFLLLVAFLPAFHTNLNAIMVEFFVAKQELVEATQTYALEDAIGRLVVIAGFLFVGVMFWISANRYTLARMVNKEILKNSDATGCSD